MKQIDRLWVLVMFCGIQCNFSENFGMGFLWFVIAGVIANVLILWKGDE